MKALALLPIALLLARSLDAATIYEQKFAEWSDSFALPQYTRDCHRWFTTDASSGTDLQICSEWNRPQQVDREVEVFLMVDGPMKADERLHDRLGSCATITLVAIQRHVFSSPVAGFFSRRNRSRSIGFLHMSRQHVQSGADWLSAPY